MTARESSVPTTHSLNNVVHFRRSAL